MTIKSLFTKLKISVFAIAVIPALIIAMLFYFTSVQVVDNAMKSLSLEMEGLNKATEAVGNYLEDQVKLLSEQGKSGEFLNASDDAKKKLIMSNFADSKAIKQITYFDNNGVEKFSVQLGKFTESGSINFRKSMGADKASNGETYCSNVFFSDTKEPFLNVTVPVFSINNGDVAGALSADISLNDVFKRFDSKISRKNSLAYIQDEKGTIIYSTGDLKEDFPHYATGAASVKEKTTGYSLKTSNGRIFLISALPIENTGLALVWKTPLQEIAKMTQQVTVNFAVTFAVSLLFAYLLSMYIANRISKPLETLTEASKDMAKGVYGSKTEEKAQEEGGTDRQDELSALAVSFEDMRDRLKNYVEENRALYSQTKERLEKRVMELRTIHSVTETFASVRNFPELLEYIVEQVQAVFDAQFCNIYLKNDKDLFVPRAYRNDGRFGDKKFYTQEFPINDPPFSDIRTYLCPIIILEGESVENDEIIKTRFPDLGLGAYCAFPLFVGDILLGVIEIGICSSQEFVLGNVQLLATIAKEASMAIENTRLYQKMSEEKQKIEAIMATISDGVISMNQNFTITSFNKAAEHITGISKENAIGMSGSDVFQPMQEDDDPMDAQQIRLTELGCLLKNAKEQGRLPLITEHQIVMPNGDKKIIELTTTLEKDEVTGKLSYVGIFRDVSKLKEMERLRSDFIDTISHELRTPLTSIKSYVSAMLHPRAKFSMDEYTSFLQIINDEANRLNRMINDLLEASRLHRGTLIIKPQPFKITTSLLDITKRKKAITTKHEILTEFDGEPMIYGDPSQVEYVIDHLLENAIKFSPEGGKILVKMISADREDVMLLIEDEGIGVPEDQREKIFNMFHRVDNRSTRRIYGPGLGLFLSKKIMEAHGRNIWVESGLQGGAKFVFTLPKYVECAIETVEMEISQNTENMTGADQVIVKTVESKQIISETSRAK